MDMNVILAQRKGVPTIVGNLIVNAGFATDALSKPGLANLAMDLLDEGTKNSFITSDQRKAAGAGCITYTPGRS